MAEIVAVPPVKHTGVASAVSVPASGALTVIRPVPATSRDAQIAPVTINVATPTPVVYPRIVAPSAGSNTNVWMM